MRANVLVVAICVCGIAQAQVIMDHAAAAAGAAIGMGAGKIFSNGIDRALQGATKTGETATETRAAKPPVKEAVTKPAPAMAPTPDADASDTPAPAAHAAAARPVYGDTTSRFRLQEAGGRFSDFATPPQRQLTASDFAAIKTGESLESVLGALGTPGSRVTIPDEGHLIEILTYSNGDERVGSVRIDNGQVAAIGN